MTVMVQRNNSCRELDMLQMYKGGKMKGIVFNDYAFNPDLISSDEIRLDNANEVFIRHSLL